MILTPAFTILVSSRIGRTGRAGAQGLSYSFFIPANARLAPHIVSILTEAGQKVPAQLLQYAAVISGEPQGACTPGH